MDLVVVADRLLALCTDLKTALVERSDFSSGTSSRSTKLIHGGVRYLQKAIMKLDYEQVFFYLPFDVIASSTFLPLLFILFIIIITCLLLVFFSPPSHLLFLYPF